MSEVTLVKLRTPGKRVMKIRAKMQADSQRVVGVELRSAEESVDSAMPVPFSVKEAQGDLVLDISIDPSEYVFKGTFWDLFVLVERESTVKPVQVSTRRAIRLRAQVASWQCELGDGMVFFARFDRDKNLAFAYRELSPADTRGHRCKELAALAAYTALRPYWKRRRMWLIYEKFCSHAQDNAFRFFEYCMNEKGGEARDFAYYVIDRDCPDYANVASYGANVVDFMSFKHMVYAMAADIYVASDSRSHLYQWRPKPNVVRGQIARHKIFFLQHGVTAMKQVAGIYGPGGSSPVTYFLTTSEREQDIVSENFGYPREKAPVLGFSRWDVLEDRSSATAPSILIMPTWRSWLDEQPDDVFLASRYFSALSSLVASPRLQEVLSRHGAKARFFIHPKFAKYLAHFPDGIDGVELVAADSRLLSELVMECSLLVTDYSSVCWDVLLKGRPVVFYQFDQDEYLANVGSYIDFDTELPGALCLDEDACVAAIDVYAQRGFTMTDRDEERAVPFVPGNDRKNRERTYRFLVDEGF